MMQHASVLHCQRAFRSLRVIGRTTITRITLFGPKVRVLYRLFSITCKYICYSRAFLIFLIWISNSNLLYRYISLQTFGKSATQNFILPSRCKESGERSVHTNMPTFCSTRHARYRIVRFGGAHRWVLLIHIHTS